MDNQFDTNVLIKIIDTLGLKVATLEVQNATLKAQLELMQEEEGGTDE